MPHTLYPGPMRKLLSRMLLFTGDGREYWICFCPVKTDGVSSFIQNHNVSESHLTFSVIPYSNINEWKMKKNENEKMTFSSIALSPYWINSKWPILIYFISFLFILWFRFFPKILKNRIDTRRAYKNFKHKNTINYIVTSSHREYNHLILRIHCKWFNFHLAFSNLTEQTQTKQPASSPSPTSHSGGWLFRAVVCL